MSSGSGGGSSAKFRAQDVFQCPELDVRMKKYLVRLANETANHLIRDTLEPNMPGVRRRRRRRRTGSGAQQADDDDDDDDDEGDEGGDDGSDGQVDARAAATNGLVWKKLSVVRGIQLLRGHDVVLAKDHARDVPAAAASCLRGLSEVNASVEEFALLFKLDSHKQFADHGLLFNPDLLDMATLYALVQPSGAHPRRYVGIKWCLVQAPSKLFRDRDFCYLECQKEFRDARGRRGWVRSMHSIKMPCCPSLEKAHGVVRASMYRCGLTAVESDKPGVLDVTYTVEMDLKGHFPELFQPSFIAQRIATLASIDKFLQQQRLSSSPLLGDLDLPSAAAQKTTCHLCYRAFSALLTRRVVCRKCGQGVCKSCSGVWELDVPVIGKTKVRICTVCSAEARYSHATPISARTADKFREPTPRGNDSETAGPAHTHQRSLSLNSTPSDFHHLRDYYDNDNDPHHPQYQQQQQWQHQQLPYQQQRQQRVSSVAGRRAPHRQSQYGYTHAQEDFHHQYFQEPAYEQYRPTFATHESHSDPFFDEYSTHGLANVRGTTDLTGLWDPRDDNQAAPIPSPASYYGSQLPQSFSEPDMPPPPPPSLHHQQLQQLRPSHKVGSPRDSTLFQQQQQVAYEDPPLDSYLEHQRRQSNSVRQQHRRHTTASGSPADPHHYQHQQPQQHLFHPDREQHQFPFRDHHGYHQHQQHQQQQHQEQLQLPPRRRQQSYPFSANQYQGRATDVYPQQRHRQQSETGMHFPTVNGGSRNFALEFFNEQYQNSSKPRSNSAVLPPQHQHQRPQHQPPLHPHAPQQQSPQIERSRQPSSSLSFETRHSQPHHEQPEHRESLQQQQEYQSTFQDSQVSTGQTAGEVVEYVETPEGEWIEQRTTVPRVHRKSVETEEEELQPGFCIHCGSKRVVQHGVIESTCTCELGGKRTIESAKHPGSRAFTSTEFDDIRASEKATATDMERLTDRMSRQTIHANGSRKTHSSYSA